MCVVYELLKLMKGNERVNFAALLEKNEEKKIKMGFYYWFHMFYAIALFPLTPCLYVWIWISSINAQRLQLEIEQLALLLSTKMDISPILCTNTLNGSPAISFSFTLSVCPSKALLIPILCERFIPWKTPNIFWWF